ncbi:alpha-1,2-fucosyltransferase [Microbacterium istanbulense]|uniref:Alpha-1,2-fucosyltransferase n=1 Tax=Microbacterium istanbulense TaxID=3122049 RepID=A0ABU8LHB9_9MICO
MTPSLGSAKRAVRRGVRRVTDGVNDGLDLLRRGERSVLATPPAGMRLGNFLYLWLNAHHRSASTGSPVLVRHSRGMDEWWVPFPRLRVLTVTPAEMRFSDRREWDGDWLYQRFGVDFTREQLHAFIRDVFAETCQGPADERLVINVRRGDFYGTEFEAKHGFDVEAYVTAALGEFPEATRALVVSDDPDWCRATLGSTLGARLAEVDYAEPDPLENLKALARADRLIGANSTFSYWGAYIADTMHTNARIVMPRFHARMAHGSDAHQLDPKWIVLDGFD